MRTGSKTWVWVGLGLLLAVVVAGCAAGGGKYTGESPAGFWAGLWHGIIAVIAFFISLFTDSVRLYEIQNSGGWYDFGFLLGVLTVWGGGCKGASMASKKKKREENWEKFWAKAGAQIKRELANWARDEEVPTAAPEGSEPPSGEGGEPAEADVEMDIDAPSAEATTPGHVAAQAPVRDEEWEEIGRKVEAKIKRKLKEWSEKE